MKRVKLIIAYDGTNYCGWQQQPNGITIEEVLNRELTRLLGEEITVIGASRTDSGVHARGNVAVFDTNARMPADKICIALNQRLPRDIVVQASKEVALNWHPRKINSRKTYEYRVLNRRVPLPDQRFNSYFYYYDLDIEKMRRAAACLVGEHDFKSFCSIRTQVEDTVRRIYDINIDKNEEGLISIRISGNGFLYNMVRIIVGSLIKVGCGFWEESRIKEALEARDRKLAGPKAPPEGLTLVSIEEEALLPLIEEKNEHWSYRLNQREIPHYGQAYIRIISCDDRDFDRLLTRLVKHASRNGAKQINVRDDTGHVRLGYKADYFTFRNSYRNWLMERAVALTASPAAENARSEATIGEVSLRPASECELLSLLELENEAFASVNGGCFRSLDDLKKDMAEGEKPYLIMYNEETVGMLSLKDIKDQEMPVLEVESISVAEEYRGQGIGAGALDFVHNMAFEQGYVCTRLVVSDHSQAIRLYERLGYVKKKCFSEWFVTQDEKKAADAFKEDDE